MREKEARGRGGGRKCESCGGRRRRERSWEEWRGKRERELGGVGERGGRGATVV